MPLLFSIHESPSHPDLSKLCQECGLELLKLSSQRKAISALKKQTPDWVVAQFFYGYGNNYAGANVSNLDVFLHSQRKYAPDAKVIVLASPSEWPHLSKLSELFELHAELRLPLNAAKLREILCAD